MIKAATGSGGGGFRAEDGYYPLSGETVSKEDLFKEMARNTKGHTPHMNHLKRKLEGG